MMAMRMNDRSFKSAAGVQHGDPPATQRSPWTLIFIGAHGETVTVRHFKVWLGLFFLLLVVVSAAAAVFYRLSRIPQMEIARLTAQLDRTSQQMAILRTENERLMTRLVLYESSVKRAAAEASVAAEPKPKPPPVPPPPKKIAAESAKPHARQAVSDAPAEPTTESVAASSPPIDVQSLSVVQEKTTGRIKIQFTIKKRTIGGGLVSGRTFVVLKGKDENPASWLSFPQVAFSGGKPESIRTGRYFSIFRFNVVRFDTKRPAHADRFIQAVVYVYDLNGHLWLKKDFPVTLPAAAASSRSGQSSAAGTAFTSGKSANTESPRAPVPGIDLRAAGEAIREARKQ